jgi:hypothetical protein
VDEQVTHRVTSLCSELSVNKVQTLGSQENVSLTKDYKSFSSAAKSRFRGMAKELGYEQLSGIFYVKSRGDWYEGFGLQASSYGNDHFYIDYGVIVPNLWPPFDEVTDLRCEGYILHQRLYDGFSQGFSNSTKDEIAKSAEIALVRYIEQAVPWFKEINTMADIAERYFETTHLEADKLGEHVYEMQLSAANYGLLLRLAGNIDESIRWLQEADRLMALPVYFTRDDRMVHVREKYARICKPEKYEVEQHENIKNLIELLRNGLID